MPTFADLRPLTADLPPIVLLSSLDFGGAGIAARRLLEGLLAAGADARMICLAKKSNLPQVGELKHPQTGQPLWNYDCALRQEVMRNYPHRPAGSEMFSLTRSLINLADFDFVKNAPLIHLHWVAGLVGFPQAKEVFAGKKLVWTLHDMNPFTGGCHYSAGCEKWKNEGCHECPQLGAPAPTVDYDLAAANFVNKYDGYQGLNLTIATPSQWLGADAKSSLLLRAFPQMTIPNGFPLDDFYPQQPDNARYMLGLPDDRKIILFGADDANNHRKGLRFLIEALGHLKNYGGERAPLLAVFGMPPRGLPPEYECKVLGRLETPQQLATAYSAADVFVLPSLEDNLPNTLIEAQACGAPGIGFAIGGIPDIIQDGVTGYLAAPQNAVDLAEKIHALLNLPAADYERMRENCRAHALANYAPELQVERYLRLYRQLLGLPETPKATARATVPVVPQAPQLVAAPIADYDYISPELKPLKPDAAFTNLMVGNKNLLTWEWSRQTIPHHHYVDRRVPDCGFLNRDEATLLYNAALPFAGAAALEIGCFLGWSACHLASAGVKLDVVDPLLAREMFAQSVVASLSAAGVRERVNLRAGLSPQEVEKLAASGKRWKFIFIDGNHEAPGPLQDAQVCEKYAAQDALIMFHDVNAPAVAAGVDYFRQHGWSIKIYHTTQIMAAAWRGKVTAPLHTPDPRVEWEIPAHLQFLAEYFERTETAGNIPVEDNNRRLADAETQIRANNFSAALKILSALKAQKINLRNLDWLRGICFANTNRFIDARQAFLEELRYFSDNSRAAEMLQQVNAALAAQEQNDLRALNVNDEFKELYAPIKNYTMVGLPRLWSLYRLARQVCENDLAGNFVECGVAAGGTSALLAAVISRHSRRPRKLFSFDTFSGMPPPTAADKNAYTGETANDSNWGTGTCAAPDDSLREIAATLGVTDYIDINKGLFSDTLPIRRTAIGEIAFLHMDGDWYQSTKDIIDNLFTQLTATTVVQVDDYGAWAGCKQALTEYFTAKKSTPTINKIDATGVWFTVGI